MTGMRWLRVVLGIAALSAGAMAQGELSVAPVNPEFERWQAGKSADTGRFGLIPSPMDWSHLERYMDAKADPPASYSLRALGQVTPVRNQYDCGSCWTFAACGALEGWLVRSGGGLWDFSENHIKNTHGFDAGHCSGGNVDMAIAYLARGSGPLNEADDPYNPLSVTGPLPGAARQFFMTGSRYFALGTGGDRSAIQTALMTHGALYVRMVWNDNAYNAATNTYYYTGDGSGPGDGGHAVTLVGWDNAKAVPGAPGPGAWLIKNSWGSGWGDGGYFHISYYDDQAVKEATAFPDLAPQDAYGRIYQYDPYGVFSGLGGSSETAFAANVFTAAADEEITAVGTYAIVPGTQLQITVYRSGYAGGFSNPSGMTTATVADAGYALVPLSAAVPVTAGQPFSVVIRYTTPGYLYPLPIELRVIGYCSAASAAPGQSYYSTNGVTFTDVTGADSNANVCIKAYAGHDGTAPTAVIFGVSQVMAGSPLTLRAQTSGTTGTVSYQWRKGAADIPGEVGSTLHFDAVNDTHAGVYRVAVTDGGKAVTVSDPFVVEVLAPGALSVANAAGLALMVSLMGLLGLRRVRRA